jgi:mannose-6-phosphate isomerase-like protein (cupin superfamily)
MITLEEFENFIQNDIVYQQRLLYYIDEAGRQIQIDNLGHLHSCYGKPIKMEGAEKLNRKIFNFCKSFKHNGPVTCHVFRAFENSASFGLHTDPDDVVIYCISGKKTMIVDGNLTTLNPHDTLYIPANTPHEAINDFESVMLSFGLEKYFIDKMK